MPFRPSLIATALTCGMWFATPALGANFFFSNGSPDGRLGALSQPANGGKLETETADDFILAETTVITHATITGLVPLGTPLSSISAVEVEIYRIFPLDSDTSRTPNVVTRVNSPADVEIDAATRDSATGTIAFTASVVSASFTVANTVVNNINKAPNQTTGGEGPATGQEVTITITFTTPVILPAGHYFFRPEVLVTGGDFLFLSTPRPGPTFAGDLQAWIRNTNLKPDWSRIGTDIIGGSPAPTFNMAFTLTGDTVPEAGNPGARNCHGQTISALARQFGGINRAVSHFGSSGVQALQESIVLFCGL